MNLASFTPGTVLIDALQSHHAKVSTIPDYKLTTTNSSLENILWQTRSPECYNIIYTPSGVESTSETLMMSGELDAAGMKRNNISLMMRQTQNHVSL